MKNPFAALFRARDKPKDAVSAAPSFYFGTSGSGKSVTAQSAIQLSTVYACVRVISETIASLPLGVFETTEHGNEKANDHEVTPAAFKEELFSGTGPITLHINSPGGDCIAASQIYTMLMDYPHDVTVQIDGMAASAASVIAMAGTHVQMSPTSMMMIHNPFTVAMGDSDEMRRAMQLLDEVKESIINAYEIKTGLSRVKLSHLMDSETWMSAHKTKALGFCDEVLYSPEEEPDDEPGFSFARKSAVLSLMNRVLAAAPAPMPEPAPEPEPAPAKPDWHEIKLNLLKYL